MGKPLTAEEASAILLEGKPLVDVVITEPLDLYVPHAESELFCVPLRFVRCSLHSLIAHFRQFTEPVEFDGVTVHGETTFVASYYFAGLRMSNCRFRKGVDFCGGGHNRDGAEFRLEACEFDGLVEFSDCWFEGPVIVRDCKFTRGARLLSYVGRPDNVTFDVPPILENNEGELDAEPPNWTPLEDK